MPSIKERHQQSAGNAEGQENKSRELQVRFYRGRKKNLLKLRNNTTPIYIGDFCHAFAFPSGSALSSVSASDCALQLEIKFIVFFLKMYVE